MKVHRVSRYAIALAVLATPVAVNAQAFGINEIGSCAAGRAFTATGTPCNDASTIFWNPAAASRLAGWTVTGGLAVIQVNGKFTQDSTFREHEADLDPELVPHAFVNYRPANSRLSFGAGLYVPYGLTSQWADDFPGRFQAKRASLATVYIQPNIAYQINDRWSVGGGPVLGHSSVELVQAIDLADQVAVPGATPVYFRQLGIARRTEFGRASMEGDAFGYGLHVGLHGKINQNWTVGLRYMTHVNFEYNDAPATFTQTMTGLVLPPGNPVCYPAGTHPICGGNPNATVDIDALVAPNFGTGGVLTSQNVDTKITHPAQLQAGFGYTNNAWTFSADYAWIGWRRFNELPVMFDSLRLQRTIIEDYNNSSAIRLGVERAFTGGRALRAGFSGVASAAPDETVTPLLPEQDRAYASLGGTLPLFGNVTLDAAYLRVMAGGKRGRIDERTSRAQSGTSLNSGVYELTANVLSLTLKAAF